MSKTPLQEVMRGEDSGGLDEAHPRPAREGSRVIVHRVVALDVADGKHARNHVGRESPISNGLTTVAADNESIKGFTEKSRVHKRGANTRRLFGLIYHSKIRHGVPTWSCS
jgi:hypothetical protein